MQPQMMHQLLIPNVVSWNAVINACDKGKLWEAAFGLLQEMMHERLTPNVVSRSAVTSACEKRKHWKGAFGLLQEMAG